MTFLPPKDQNYATKVSPRRTATKSPVSRRKFLASAAVTVLPSVAAIAQPSSANLLALFTGEPRPGEAQPGAKAASPKTEWKTSGVIDLTNSQYAKLKTVPVRAVVIQEGFWSQRRKTNLMSSIPSMHDELLEHGRMDNFLRLEGKSSELNGKEVAGAKAGEYLAIKRRWSPNDTIDLDLI